MIQEITDSNRKEKICRAVLAALPDWFGIPESTEEYVAGSMDMPFWADIDNDTVRGFVSMKETSPYTAEIYVMGVLPQYHHCGIGKELFQHLYQYAKEKGYGFLQVKTVKEGCYPEYDRTNSFYRSMGFYELEVLEELWGPGNPCQLYIMAIQ